MSSTNGTQFMWSSGITQEMACDLAAAKYWGNRSWALANLGYNISLNDM